MASILAPVLSVCNTSTHFRDDASYREQTQTKVRAAQQNMELFLLLLLGEGGGLYAPPCGISLYVHDPCIFLYGNVSLRFVLE